MNYEWRRPFRWTGTLINKASSLQLSKMHEQHQGFVAMWLMQVTDFNSVAGKRTSQRGGELGGPRTTHFVSKSLFCSHLALVTVGLSGLASRGLVLQAKSLMLSKDHKGPDNCAYIKKYFSIPGSLTPNHSLRISWWNIPRGMLLEGKYSPATNEVNK